MRKVAILLTLPLLMVLGQDRVWAQEGGGEGDKPKPRPATPEARPDKPDKPADPAVPKKPEEPEPTTPEEKGPTMPGAGPVMPGDPKIHKPGEKPAAAPKPGKPTEEKQYWKDIKVVSRKLILKQKRVELFVYPMGVTLNDNLIRHWFLGGEISYFLSDAMSVGAGGHYYLPDITERAYLMGLQQRVLPTLNKYLFTATANFNYNWMYAKFALHNWFIQQFGGYVGAGVGVTMTEIIPRRAGDSSWKNYNFTILFPSFGFRMFILKWLTVNIGIRLYIMRDRFEASNRPADDDPDLPPNYKPESHAAHRWIPNLVFNLGVSFFLPPSFKYTTVR